MLAGDLVVRAGHDRGDVAGHDRGGREVPPPRRPRARLARDVRGHVRQHPPALRREHRELEGRLQVGLVEARVDPVCVVGLQVGVEVRAAVGRVGEPVQSLAAARVGAVGGHPQLVLGRQAVQHDPVAVEGRGRDGGAVEHDLADGRGGELDEAAGPGAGAAEPDRAGGPERLRAAGEIELYPVGIHLQQPPSFPCLVPGEVIRHLAGTFLCQVPRAAARPAGTGRRDDPCPGAGCSAGALFPCSAPEPECRLRHPGYCGQEVPLVPSRPAAAPGPAEHGVPQAAPTPQPTMKELHDRAGAYPR